MPGKKTKKAPRGKAAPKPKAKGPLYTPALPGMEDEKSESLRKVATEFDTAKKELADTTRKLKQALQDAETDLVEAMDKLGKTHYWNSELGLSVDIAKPAEKRKVTVRIFTPAKAKLL